jgi:cyclin C
VPTVVLLKQPRVGDQYGCKSFPSEPSKLAEMEFYLLTELECDMTVHHPYKTLLSLCTKRSSEQLTDAETELGELGSSGEEIEMTTGDGRLELDVQSLQLAWWARRQISDDPC